MAPVRQQQHRQLFSGGTSDELVSEGERLRDWKSVREFGWAGERTTIGEGKGGLKFLKYLETETIFGLELRPHLQIRSQIETMRYLRSQFATDFWFGLNY